ncbi:MAG TPA: hypothetical protein VK250_07670 [Nitrososphaeraceae archaeon]|nr:hypothetical protein [Nitrososphaeraceae archaeon]
MTYPFSSVDWFISIELIAITKSSSYIFVISTDFVIQSVYSSDYIAISGIDDPLFAA